MNKATTVCRCPLATKFKSERANERRKERARESDAMHKKTLPSQEESYVRSSCSTYPDGWHDIMLRKHGWIH